MGGSVLVLLICAIHPYGPLDICWSMCTYEITTRFPGISEDKTVGTGTVLLFPSCQTSENMDCFHTQPTFLDE